MGTLKKMKTEILLIGCSSILLLSVGCSKDNPLNPAGACFGGLWAEQYASELQAWSEATAAYSENPTAENCASYKSAAKGYLDAVESVYDCIPAASQGEIDEAVAEAKADIDAEACGG